MMLYPVATRFLRRSYFQLGSKINGDILEHLDCFLLVVVCRPSYFQHDFNVGKIWPTSMFTASKTGAVHPDLTASRQMKNSLYKVRNNDFSDTCLQPFPITEGRTLGIMEKFVFSKCQAHFFPLLVDWMTGINSSLGIVFLILH